MGSAASRIQALAGPWEVHTYSLKGYYRVQYHDTDGTNVTIAQTWDRDYADLLERAWAVPELMDLLQRLVNRSEVGASVEDLLSDVFDLVPDARALLERLT